MRGRPPDPASDVIGDGPARAEVEALYESHDLFCFPSFREPAGGVLYEAMRHGLPVITTDRGGPRGTI